MVLNKKQKMFVFTDVLSDEDKVKIFETTDIKWLTSQRVAIGKDDGHGWKPLIVNGEEMTLLNFKNNPGWQEVLDHIDEYEQCQWCGEWFLKDEMIIRKRGFTKLCDRCDYYLKSRGEL